MKLKRLLAFILDMVIIYIVANLLFMLCFNNQYEKFVNNSEKYMEKVQETIKKSDSNNASELRENTKKISYDYIKSGTTETIIVLSLEIFYFIFVQYFNNGQTIGKKVFKLQVKQDTEKKLSAGLFVLRESILFLIPIQIIDVICLLTTKMNTYFAINTITSNIQTLTNFAIIGFILFRKDGKGLHDLISHTEVIRLNKVEK